MLNLIEFDLNGLKIYQNLIKFEHFGPSFAEFQQFQIGCASFILVLKIVIFLTICSSLLVKFVQILIFGQPKVDYSRIQILWSNSNSNLEFNTFGRIPNFFEFDLKCVQA